MNMCSRDTHQSSTAGFLELPIEDIICNKIFIYLSLSEVCTLRFVSKYFKFLSETYFGICHVLDFSIPGSHNRFSGENFEQITTDSKRLRELNLRMCKKWLQNRLLIPVLTRNSFLKTIDISGCLAVTNEAIKVLALECKSLETVILQECRWLSSEAVKLLGLECHTLKTLVLNGCWNISNESLCTVFQNNHFLRHVDVGGCYGIEGDTICFMSKRCIDIEYLGIKGCWRVRDDAIRVMREYCKGLQELKVKDCTKVTEASLAMLRVRGVIIDVEKPAYYHRPSVAFGFNREVGVDPPSLYLQI